MKIGTPFTVDEFTQTAGDDTQSFEFSQNNIWNDSFYSPEIPNGNNFALLQKDIADIKELIADIRNIVRQHLDN